MNDIGKEYASNPPHAGQDCPGLVKGLCGRGQVKGHRGMLHLHERLANYTNLAHGVVLVLDPEDGKLEPGQRYLGNGFGPANRATDAVNFAVTELGKGLLGLQELFLIEARCHRGEEAEHILIPRRKFAFVSASRVIASVRLG